jgi:hypothetical protein
MTNFTQPTPGTAPATTAPDNRPQTAPLAKPQTGAPSGQPQPATGKSNVEPKLPIGGGTENAGGGIRTGASPVAPSQPVLSNSSPKAPATTEPSKAAGEHSDTPKTESGPNDRANTQQPR